MNEPRSSFGAHLRAAMTVTTAAAVVLAAIDAAGSMHGIGVIAGLAVATYLTGIYGIALTPVALLLAVGTRLAPVDDIGPPRAWLAGAGAAAGLVAVTYSAILWTRRLFNNVELGALLASIAAATTAVVLAGAVAISVRAARSRRARVVVSAAWGIAGATATGWVIYQNRSGFSQLSTWLLVMPFTLLAVAIASVALRKRLLAARRLTFAGPVVVILGFCAAVAMEVGKSDAGDHVATYAPLGTWLAPAVHAVTDFDDDGFSGLIGGGDCAPMDPDIAPGNFDVPGDGIDNNCFGGDSEGGEAAPAPEWFDLPEAAQKLDVVVITIETLRADHVGFMGYERDTTPNLDALAKTAVVFDRFYATSTFTRLSLPSLLTSRTPSRIEWEKQKKSKFPRIALSNPWLPEAFKKSGYRTASFTADFPAFTETDSIGFKRAFDHYDPSAELKYKGGTMRGFPSKKQVGRITSWLDDRKPADRLFLWAHLFEPHYSYQQFPGAPKFGKERIDKYDSEIWGADKAIGQIVEHLKSTGRWDRTILVVTGDHGEEFGEHGQKYHGSNLYEPQTRIPLLIRIPGVAAMRIEQPSSMVDLAPTVLNLANLKGEFDTFGGRNLTPLLYGQTISERPLYLEVWDLKSRGKYRIAVVNWPFKLVASGTSGKKQELYELARDPEEQDNLIKKRPKVAATMRELLRGYLEATNLEYQ